METSCTPAVEKPLWNIHKELIITEIKSIHDIKAFSRFVYNVYQKTYHQQYNWIPTCTAQSELEKEDLRYASDSRFFVCCTRTKEILGTCRITKKNDHLTFPIEDVFKININHLVKRLNLSIEEFWHLGRLSVDKDKLSMYSADPKSAAMIMKKLLMASFEVICRSTNNLLIAETDSKVFRMLNQIGINVEMIGLPRHYMGSITLPTIVLAKDLNLWACINKNSH